MKTTAAQSTETLKRRASATRNTLLRIAALKIAVHGLDDTPEEYIAKCIERTEGRS